MSRSGPATDESSGELLQLLEMLNEQLIIELGKPLPSPERLPRLRNPRCPAAHNRALLDRGGEDQGKGL